MGNISPIGVLNDVFKTIHAGQLATKKEEQLKAQRSAEIADKGVTSTFDVLKTDPSLAYSFITSNIPSIRNQRLFFKENRPNLYSTILNVAMQPRKLTERDKKLIDQSKGNPTFAKTILKNMPNLPEDVKKIIFSHASTIGLTEEENRLFQNVKNKNQAISLRNQLFPVIKQSKVFEPSPGGKAELTIGGSDGETIIDTNTNKPIEGYDREYRGGNLDSGLFYLLTSRIEEEDEVNPLSLDELKVMKDDIKNSSNPLQTYKFYKDKITTKDIKAHMFLENWKTSYVQTGQATNIGKILNDTVETIDKFGTTEYGLKKSAMLAEKILNYPELEALINNKVELNQILTMPANDYERKLGENIQKLIVARDIINKIDKKENQGATNLMLGTTDLGIKNINEATKSRVNSNNFLEQLNGFAFYDGDSKLNINAYLKKLNNGNNEDKQKRNDIINNIKSVLKAHSNYVAGTTVPMGTLEGSEKRDEAPDSYADRFKNLYEIPEIKLFITSEEGLNQADPSQSIDPNPINANQFVLNSENTLLPENQVRMKGGEVIQVSNDTVSFASWAGFPNVKAMLKDEGYTNTLDLGSSEVNGLVLNSDTVIKVANKIRKVVPNVQSVSNLKTKDFAKIGYILTNNDLNDNLDAFNVLSILMSNKHKFVKPKSKLAFSATEINNVVKDLTKNYVDIEKLDEKNEHLTKYIQLLNNALLNIDFEGTATQIGIGLRNVRVDIFGQDGLISEAGKLILPENIEFDLSSGVSAAQQAENIKKSVLAFEQRVQNAELRSTLITLAYHRARSLDPAGRISDRDFQASLDSLTAGLLANNKVSKNLINNFLEQAKSEELFFTKVSDVLANFNTNGGYRLLNSHIRTFRALPHYNKLKTMSRSIRNMRDYKAQFEDNGTYDDVRYELSLVKEDNDNPENSVYEVFYKGTDNPIARGIPVYTDNMGKILTIQELRTRGVRL